MGIVNLFSKSQLNDTYKSIDELPLYNWYRIHKDLNYTWLLKIRQSVSNKKMKELEDIWKNIVYEFIDEFDMSETMKRILFLQRDIRVLESEMYITKDYSRQTDLEIMQYELKSIMNDDKGLGLLEVCDIIGEHRKFVFDERKETVRSFYSALKRMKKNKVA